MLLNANVIDNGRGGGDGGQILGGFNPPILISFNRFYLVFRYQGSIIFDCSTFIKAKDQC